MLGHAWLRSIEIFHEQGDAAGEAASLVTLGSLEYALSDYAVALERFHEALLLARAAGDRQLESNALNGAATSHFALGDYPRAAELYLESLTIRRELGDRATESGTLSNLGLVYQELGDFAAAADLHREALEVKRELGDRQGEANVLANLGVDLHRLGEHEEARALHREALRLAREIGNRQTEAGCLENLGLIAEAVGELPEALALHETALAMQRSLGNRSGEASSLAHAGAVRSRLGDRTGALDNLQASLRIAEEVGARRLVIDTRRSLADVYAGLGDLRAALECSNGAAAAQQEMFREQLERSTAALLAGFKIESAQREAELERRRSDELERANAALRRVDEEREDLLGRLRAQATELERLSREDLVTGLTSRRHFEDELDAWFARALANATPLSVAILDVDHFKLVNDIPRSHRVGDAVLREIAAMLRVGVRDTDLVARWGGEEFALLIDDDREAAASCLRAHPRGDRGSRLDAAAPEHPGHHLGRHRERGRGSERRRPALRGRQAALRGEGLRPEPRLLVASPRVSVVDLLAGDGRGPLWGDATDDLNLTLLAWPAGDGPPEHVNAERDVVVVVLEGSGTALLDGVEHDLRAGQAVVIPRGCQARGDGGQPKASATWPVHLRRGGLQISRPPR